MMFLLGSGRGFIRLRQARVWGGGVAAPPGSAMAL